MSQNGVSKTKIALFYAGWWLLLEVLETYALIKTFNLDWHVALTDALNTNLLIATAGYFMFSALNYYRPSPKNAMYLLVWSVIMSGACVLLHNYLLSHYWFQHNEAYQHFLQASTIMRGLFCWLMIMLIVIMSYIWYYMRDQQDAEQRQNDALKLAREAELTNLRQQLQPHFLFNSLNSISALAGSRPEEARKMVQQLSDFLRGTIRRDNSQMVPLSEEIHHLNLYLEIEKVRFGHRLRTEIIADESLSALLLPPLLLQPIVENAIKFGLYDTVGEITISINASKEADALSISVHNPFDPDTASPRQGTGFGLQSIQRRLYLLFARQDLLQTSKAGNIFTTTVKIPQPQ
ncbi:sensor histidine kinase [Pseudochryseolinea flava]|uniref:Sensor histidine kinase n=1 Tax=Pseudochryseolinea flava TaxID=2059302 RepID=A0A364XXS1_9BACT|nr:histidine kinase [Pseudochryseolinea flava]RAV99081.1 sensor histidine kinase [Pseudochryseolinea flava]